MQNRRSFLWSVVPDRAHDIATEDRVPTESRWFLVSEKKLKSLGVSWEVADDLWSVPPRFRWIYALIVVSSSSYSFTGRHTMQYV